MSVQSVPWTDNAFGPGAIHGTDAQPDKQLNPYRVTVGENVYDQSAFTADTDHRFHNFTSGVGAGKTVSGIMRMLANVQAWNPGETGMIVAPNSIALKNVILPELSKWGILDSWEYRGPQSAEPGLHAPNGTRVLLESANNDRKIERLRGPTLAWFWMDEAAIIPKKAWNILTGRLRTGNYRNAWITTTPRGFNWVYDVFHPESDNQIKSVNNVLGVPSYANPHLPIDYRRDILGEWEGHFRQQEVLGAFVQPEGLVHDWFDRDEHIVSPDELPRSFDKFIYGVDWGFYPHPACVLAIGVAGDDYYALEEHYETRNTVSDLADVIVGPDVEADIPGMFDRWGRGPVYCDPSEPENIHTFKQRGITAKKAKNDVEPGIQHVTSLADNFYVSSTCQNLINEFNQYRYQDGGDDVVKESDHAQDAGRYALFTDDTAIRGGGTTIEW